MSSRRGSLPGFGLSMGIGLSALSLLVLLPLSLVFVKTASGDSGALWATISSDRALAAYALSFGASLVAALINSVFGLLVAWALVRYSFPGRRIVDALVDLPFALPTAVGGLALTALYSEHGWVGSFLKRAHIDVAFTRLGVVVALTFVGLPFVVRTVQPALEELEEDVEEAAACLGADRATILRRIVFPVVAPALLAGFVQAFARGIGEYGSVIFIAGNMPGKTEIAPLLIMTKLEQYDYVGATALAAVMLTASLGMLLVVNAIAAFGNRRLGRGT